MTETRTVRSVEGIGHGFGRDPAVLVALDDRDLPALPGQLPHRVEDGLVLGGRRDEVVPLPLGGLGQSLDGEVIRFGRARGEDDLPALGADGPRHLLPGDLDRLLGLPAESVGDARGVAVELGEVREHRLDDPRVGAGGGVVVEIDRTSHAGLPHQRSVPGRPGPNARASIITDPLRCAARPGGSPRGPGRSIERSCRRTGRRACARRGHRRPGRATYCAGSASARERPGMRWALEGRRAGPRRSASYRATRRGSRR